MKEESRRPYNAPYEGPHLSRVAFPLGGIGTGMLCVEGSGALSHVSVRNTPDIFNEPMIFAAVKVLDHNKTARLLEGPVPGWKIFGARGAGNGARGQTYGFPRFDVARFEARFPFARIELADPAIPLKCHLTAWSPFLPGNADDSSLPMAVLEYTFQNQTQKPFESVFSFHAANFMSTRTEGDSVGGIDHGFVLHQTGSDEIPSDEGAFSVTLLDSDVSVDCAWFRGGWFDAATILWQHIDNGHVVANPPLTEGAPSPGGSVYLPFSLQPDSKRIVNVVMAWHVPKTTLRLGSEKEACCIGECAGHPDTHIPWYAKRFATIESVTEHAWTNLERLRLESVRFCDCFFDTTLPPEVIEAVAANLTILKSPTVLRQTNGRLWCWEGCRDSSGCCAGSCTHVWNYAQALPHLFPELERSLRQTEFNESQNAEGHQGFRSALPIRELVNHDPHAAADGQLGGIMKAFREWRILGDSAWLKEFWPKITVSLDYCIKTWDPEREGILREPHHNTYDIEFWGPDGMCMSFYLGALKAASLMAAEMGEDGSRYEELYRKGRTFMETELYNGEYFIQQIQWTGLRAGDPTEAKALVNIDWSPEAIELVRKEGPKYQYGTGCLSDGVLGAWIAAVCGIGEILNPEKVKSHLLAIYKYNLKHDLTDHANPQRPGYAMGKEGGLLLCTWPKGDELSLPFVYSNEVWTGIEYQVASHLLLMGCVEEGLEIAGMTRSRYDGRVRNPFNEYECGHWYARALASYGLLQGLTGDSQLGHIDFNPNTNLKSMTEKVLQLLNLNNIKVIDNFNLKNFTDIETDALGMPAFKFLESYAKKRQVLLSTNGEGDIVFIRAGKAVNNTVLSTKGDTAATLLKVHVVYDDSKRFNEYQCIGQQNTGSGADFITKKSPKDASSIEAKIFDNEIRDSRKYVFQPEENGTSTTNEDRAKWEANYRKSNAMIYNAKVQGFKPLSDDGLWDLNTLVHVVDDFSNIGDTQSLLLITEIEYIEDLNEGTITNLKLMNRDSFTTIVNQPEKDKKDFNEGGDFIARKQTGGKS